MKRWRSKAALALATLATGLLVMPTTAEARPIIVEHTDFATPAYRSGCLLDYWDDAIGSVAAQSITTCTLTSQAPDNVWRGIVRDNLANDGRCVQARMQGIVMAVSCDSAGFRFQFTDPDRNSNAATSVCTTNRPNSPGRCSGTSNVNF